MRSKKKLYTFYINHVLAIIFQSHRRFCQTNTHRNLTKMGKVKQKIIPGLKSKITGQSLEKPDRKSFKAQPKKNAELVSKGKAKIQSGTIKPKKKPVSSSSKAKKEMMLQMNFALPPKCSFLVQTPSSDPSVACFEGPGVSIKLPINQDSTGQAVKAKKDSLKMVRRRSF